MACPAELVKRFEEGAKKMCFSKSSIAHFPGQATPGQLRAVCDLLDFEMEVRKENRRRRLMRRAAFPAVKSIDDFDFAEVVMPEGYSREEMANLGFVASVFRLPSRRGRMSALPRSSKVHFSKTE